MNQQQPLTPEQKAARRARILHLAEQELGRRVLRRRTILVSAGGVAVATALFVAWAVSPLEPPSQNPHNPGTSEQIATTTTRTPGWISLQDTDGAWLSDEQASAGWLINGNIAGDWLSDAPNPLQLASDDELDQLVAQNPQVDERGVVRIGGRVVLAKDLPPMAFTHHPESLPEDEPDPETKQ